MSKDWERHGLCCEQLWETGECDCEARDVMRVTAGLPKRAPAPHTLSERMHGVANGWRRIVDEEDGEFSLLAAAHRMDIEADEVAALEAEIDRLKPAPITPVDKLNQGYERAGLSSALVVNNKYGKHSAFGYMGRK